MLSSRCLLRSHLRVLSKTSTSPFLPNHFTAAFATTPYTMAQEYKLKGLTSIDLKPGEKREYEIEGIEEGKVLLCNVGGKTTAIGSKCTHYGAPLVKGVLTGDGRLTCPWHGACFNASTGDIENAPALDALPAFKLSEKDGAVYVTGEQSAFKGSKRKPNIKCKAIGQDKVVIIGFGDGGLATLETLRENGYKGAITVIGSEGYLPIDRTKLSKALIDDPSKVEWRDEAFFKSADVDIVSDEATAVDFSSKKVTTKSGKTYPYTKLVLATGGSPQMLPLPGFKDLENIFLLRTIHHTKKINAAIGEGKKKIVIIGSSFIGMEVANCTAKNNEVTVVGMEQAPLERIMGKQVGQIFQKTLEGNGAKFYMGAGVEGAYPSESDSSKVGYIKLKDGTKLEADLVILGTGVKPATSFLKENSAVTLEEDGSLRTDESFAVQGLKDVFAIGDIATYPYHGPGGEGHPTRIEHWNVAHNSGRSVGKSIADPSAGPKAFIPIFWSALGSQLRYCGNTHGGFDDLVLKGEPDKAKFAAYYCKGETIVAVATMGMDPIMSQSSELMRRGKMPSKTEIKGMADMAILEVQVPSELKI